MTFEVPQEYPYLGFMKLAFPRLIICLPKSSLFISGRETTLVRKLQLLQGADSLRAIR